MAGLTTHRRRVLAWAFAAGVLVGTLFIVLDVVVDVLFLGEGPLARNLVHPVELWVRVAAMIASILGALAYARLLLAKEDVAGASQTYRALAESARDDIFIVDGDRRISYMNTHAAGEWGTEPGALVGKHVRELFPGPEIGRVVSNLDRAFEGVEAYSEVEFTFEGGSKWLSTRLVPMRAPDGSVVSVLGISRDVTGTRREIALSNALSRISVVVHARLSVEEILRAVSIEATAAVGVDSSMVMTRDEEGWTVRFTQGYADDVVGTRLATYEATVAQRASLTRRTVAVDDARNDFRVNPETIERFGICSMLAVPLVSRKGVVGVLLFTQRSRTIHFGRDIVDFVSRVGTTVSLAIDNARLYEEQRSVADLLQSAILMLPERLPGVEFAHVYRSATEAARVGGDFYDLFELEHDKVGITVGDISGHGIDAAVLTSLVKNGIRVEATQEDRPPDDVVRRASALLLESSPPEVFATVFFGVLDLASGLLQYCNAGHTTGFICTAGGCGVRGLPANSPLAGAFADQRFSLSSEEIGEDDLLFLYTDGLTEARKDVEMFGEQRLFRVLEATESGSPDDIVRHVMAEVMAFTGNSLRDDLAILTLRRAKR